ncbi:MAG: hypothetical protein JWL58_2069, partial [Streptosporangiaceae bacterium]|nr:hypothetical protein [Streptosporangiaceae bacterium]
PEGAPMRLRHALVSVPCGLLWSTEHALGSVQRIRALADRVWMCHDTQIEKFQESGFPLTTAVADAETAAAHDSQEAQA